MENKKTKITFLTVILLIITIISIVAVIAMYNVVKETRGGNEKEFGKIIETNVDEKGVEKQDVQKFIDTFYFMGDDVIIPDFDDINRVDEDWLWLAAYFNLVRAEQDPGMYVTKAQVEDSAKEIFGENLNKEFPTEGIEFWLEPEDGKYFVGRAGLDPDYVNDYEIIDMTTEENEIIVEIAEYKYNVLRDDNILEIMNIENNKTVAKLNREDYTETDPKLFHSTRLYDETIPDLVSDNIEQFSKARLTLKMNEQTNKLYIVSLERNNEDNNEIANVPFDTEGDSAAWLEVECNYNVNNRIIKVGKYTRKIESKIAVLNESGTYTETMSLKEKVIEMYNSIKNNDFYKNDKYKVTEISIKNGNTESEEEYYNNSRAKKIKVTVNNDKEYIFELEDTNKTQVFDIDVIQNDMSTPMVVDIEVQEIYQGLKSDEIYITEIGFGYESGGLGAR